MSKPTNSAARNVMSEFERQCYDWGWEDAEKRIIKLLEELRLKHLPWCGKQDCVKCEQTIGIEQAIIAITEGEK
jgi:hypothetical protein